MDNNVPISNVPGTEPTPIPTPAPPVAPTPTPVPAPVPPTPTFADGGAASSNPIKRFFSDVSFTDVGIIILATAAFGYVIYYYREQIKNKKKDQQEVQAKMDELESNLKMIAGQNYKSFN